MIQNYVNLHTCSALWKYAKIDWNTCSSEMNEELENISLLQDSLSMIIILKLDIKIQQLWRSSEV